MTDTANLDFREYLVVELVRRCSDNPRYSLRAFARFLREEHATLSQVLRGKRALSAATIRKLGVRLGLDAAAVERFVASTRPRPDVSAAIGWLERAILEHVRTKDFVADVPRIARTLDCTNDDVQIALHRLLRLGLVEMDAGRWTSPKGA